MLEFRFVPSVCPETEDDQYDLYDGETYTGISIQVSGSEFCVDRYVYKGEKLLSSISIGSFPDVLSAQVAALVAYREMKESE